jgi:hypothetical protein
MGAVAIGAVGCASQGTGTVTAEQAAAGSSMTSSTGTTPGTTTQTTTGSDPSTAVPSSSADSSPSSGAGPTTPSASQAPTTPAKPTTPTPSKTPPTTPAPTKTTPKPSPSAGTGTGWLAGVPIGSNKPGALDPRCLTGRVICVDMNTRTLLWVIDGKPQYGMDVRFGDENNPTRKGQFSLYMKMKDCVSTIYHTPMPDAMFFSGGEAVHFSIDFKTYGYAHHSHGCVNVRDRVALDRLFADTKVGDSVVVY